MKLITMTSLAILLGASSALAVDPASPSANTRPPTASPSSSGRPSAVLDDSQCQTVWSMAAPNGDTLSADKATPYVLNFKMVEHRVQGRLQEGLGAGGQYQQWRQARPHA
jgi:hypothetical protein